MGQALDKDGNVLGEVTGATKQEVFDTLMRDYPEADQIQIRNRAARDAQAAKDASAGKPVGDGVVDDTKAVQAKIYQAGKDRMLQFFQYSHLPPHLAEASEPFCALAERIVAKYPMNPERTVALRKLLEAKDAAVRSLLYKE